MEGELKPWSVACETDGSCAIYGGTGELRGRYRSISDVAGALCTALEALDGMRAEVGRLRAQLAEKTKAERTVGDGALGTNQG